MRNLIPVLMLIMSLPAMAFAPEKPGYRDSIHVLEKYRLYFNDALESVFGAKAVNFSYTATGNLIYNGEFKSSSAQESNLFKRLNHLMAKKRVTNVIYEIRVTIVNKCGRESLIDTKGHSGEATVSRRFNRKLLQNYVVVDRDAEQKIVVQVVTEEYYKNWPFLGKGQRNFFPESLAVNHVIDTWHGLGHIIYAGKKLNRVIDFENWVREIYKIKNADGAFIQKPMPLRKYDQQHNRMIIYYDPDKVSQGFTPPLPP